MTITTRICSGLAACLTVLPQVTVAQDPTDEQAERIEWIQDTGTSIRSIDPADDDFADLMPLRESIGNARVVVLGEATHGDGATFLLKVRLIKFLHREMGFDVVAWESGINDCGEVDELLSDAKTPLVDAIEGISPPWAMAAQLRPLFEHVRASHATKQPITTVGLDCQLTSRHSPSYLALAARKLFAKLNPSPLSEDVMRWEQTLAAYHVGKRYAKSIDEANRTEKATDTMALCNDLRAMIGLIDQHRTELEKQASPVEVELVRRRFISADYQVRLMHASDPSRVGAGMAALSAERDRLMGENLIFLASRVMRERKIIVWCAMMHALHGAAAIADPANPESRPLEGMATMGEVARRELGSAMYTVGFTAGRGSYGWVFQKDATHLPEPEPGWIEFDCAATKQRFLFVDFRGIPRPHWLRQPQIMRPLGFSAGKAVWPDQMDAVVYIDEMFRTSREGMAPAGYQLTIRDK